MCFNEASGIVIKHDVKGMESTFLGNREISSDFALLRAFESFLCGNFFDRRMISGFK